MSPCGCFAVVEFAPLVPLEFESVVFCPCPSSLPDGKRMFSPCILNVWAAGFLGCFSRRLPWHFSGQLQYGFLSVCPLAAPLSVCLSTCPSVMECFACKEDNWLLVPLAKEPKPASQGSFSTSLVRTDPLVISCIDIRNQTQLTSLMTFL